MKKATANSSASTAHAAGITQHMANCQGQSIARVRTVSFGRQTAAQKNTQSVISRETLHIYYTHEVQNTGQNLAGRFRNRGKYSFYSD